TPRRELQSYLESIWIFESPNGLPAHDASIIAPNGCPKLIFLAENSLVTESNGKTSVSPEGKLYFVGNKVSSALLRTNSTKTGFIGFEFRPGGAFPFFKIPMSETFNDFWEADALFGRWGLKLQEGLNDLTSKQQMVAFVQQRLIVLLPKNVCDNRLVE